MQKRNKRRPSSDSFRTHGTGAPRAEWPPGAMVTMITLAPAGNPQAVCAAQRSRTDRIQGMVGLARRRLLLAASLAVLARPGIGGDGSAWEGPTRPGTAKMAEYAALAHDAQREAFQNDGERRVAAGRACPIERLEWGTLTPAEFAERFVAAGRPVIFTDAMSSYATRPQDWLTKDGFVAAFGEIEAKAGTGAELAQYGGRSDRPPMKLRDIVGQFGSQTDPDNELFVFDMQVSAQLKRSFEEPAIFTDTFMAPFKGEAKWNMLSLGGDGLGLGFHTHADSWLGLFAGIKRWLLFEPGSFPTGEKLFPNRMLGVDALMRQWQNSTREHPHLLPLDCYQFPGELLYLPAGYAHATQNLGDSIGIGGQTQICSGAAHVSQLPITLVIVLLVRRLTGC